MKSDRVFAAIEVYDLAAAKLADIAVTSRTMILLKCANVSDELNRLSYCHKEISDCRDRLRDALVDYDSYSDPDDNSIESVNQSVQRVRTAIYRLDHPELVEPEEGPYTSVYSSAYIDSSS